MQLLKGVEFMKLIKIFSFVVSLMLSVIISGSNFIMVGATTNSCEEGMTCKSKSFNNNIVCFETIMYSPEISTFHQDGTTTYKKKVTIKREYKRADTMEILTDCTVGLTFKYDKDSSVTCKCSMLEKNKKNYYLKPLMEIFSEEKISTGSVKYTLYQKNILESYDYIADGHIDVFCSSVGDIGINSNRF